MSFGNLGLSGLILILVAALLVFGPSKLPEIGRAFGKSLKEFKDATREMVGESKPQTPPQQIEQRDQE